MYTYIGSLALHFPRGLSIDRELQNKGDLEEALIFEKWNSLPLEVAIYFATLDKLTTEDEFFLAMRNGAYVKLSEAGFKRVGHLIATTEDDLAARASLSKAELAKVRAVLRRLGVGFGMDTTRWDAYRTTVDEDFRLDVPYGTRLPNTRGNALLT